MRRLGAGDDGGRVELRVGDELELRLAENPTTGHRWRLVELEPAVLEVTRDEFRPPDPSRAGAGGERVWALAARGPGESTLRLAYARGWAGAPAARTFVLTIAVR